jgi:hypothetical protein
MHWYEWLLVGMVWALIPACLFAKGLLEARWLRKFGERKPR